MPVGRSKPTLVAGARSPPCSTAVMDRAAAIAREVVTTMPPDATTSPVATETPFADRMIRATVEGRILAIMAATVGGDGTRPTPASVVGTSVSDVRSDGEVSRPSGPFVVATTSPAATRARIKQAVAPPTSQGPVRSRVGPNGAGARAGSQGRTAGGLRRVTPQPIVRGNPAAQPVAVDVIAPVVIGFVRR